MLQTFEGGRPVLGVGVHHHLGQLGALLAQQLPGGRSFVSDTPDQLFVLFAEDVPTISASAKHLLQHKLLVRNIRKQWLCLMDHLSQHNTAAPHINRRPVPLFFEQVLWWLVALSTHCVSILLADLIPLCQSEIKHSALLLVPLVGTD